MVWVGNIYAPTGKLQIFDEDQADDFDPFVPLPRKELHSVRVIKVPVC